MPLALHMSGRALVYGPGSSVNQVWAWGDPQILTLALPYFVAYFYGDDIVRRLKRQKWLSNVTLDVVVVLALSLGCQVGLFYWLKDTTPPGE